MATKHKTLRRYLLTLVPVGLVLGLWQIVHLLGLADPSMLPGPGRTLVEAFRLFASGSILPDFLATGSRMGVAFLAAAVVGVSLGLVIGASRVLHAMAVPVIDFIRSTPVTILYPVVVLLLGVASAAKIAMVFLGCVFVIMLNTAYGVSHSSSTRKEMAQVYGASRWQLFGWVIFFDSLPQTMIGLRVSLSYALVIEVLCEMFMGSKYGLGQRVTEAYTTYSIVEMYALIIIVGMFGFLLNRGFVFIERRALPWVVREHT